jgi:GT2 family glycosyltransferase
MTPSVTVVIATRNRAAELCSTLGRLAALPERPPVIVVDNASHDGTVAAVGERYPLVRLITLPRNFGAQARNFGAVQAATPYVAFSDDDSWWEPGSLAAAAAALDDHAELGLVTGRTLVGRERVPDPINAVLAASPLPRGPLPGPRVLGFLACAAVARRRAFLAVGGFHPLLFIGAEEALLALDLAAAGWPAVYLDDVVARHDPSESRDAAGRQVLVASNEVLIRWMRRPAWAAMMATARLSWRAPHDRRAAAALIRLLRVLPGGLMSRKTLPPAVEADARLLERSGAIAIQRPGPG